MFEVCWQSRQDKTEEPKLCFIKGKPEQLGSAKCYHKAVLSGSWMQEWLRGWYSNRTGV